LMMSWLLLGHWLNHFLLLLLLQRNWLLLSKMFIVIRKQNISFCISWYNNSCCRLIKFKRACLSEINTTLVDSTQELELSFSMLAI
jgi:hypothetical protein